MNNAAPSSAQQFYQGMVSHSKTSIWSAILFLFIASAVALTTVDEDFVYSDFHRYLASHAIDERLFVTERAYALFSSGNEHPKFVVLGGSASLVASSTPVINASLENYGYEHYNLAWSRQSLLESLYLVSRLPEHSKGVILVGVGPSRVAIDRNALKNRITRHGGGLTSAPFDEAMRKHDFQPADKTGFFLIDNRKFLLARYRAVLKNLVFGAPQRAVHAYFGATLQGNEAFDKIATRVDNRIAKGYQDSVDLNLELLGDIIALARSNTEMEVVLVEHPINPRFVSEYLGTEFYVAHKQRVSDFAAEHGVDYVDIAAEHLQEELYFDWTHLAFAAAADDYTTALLKELSTRGHIPDL
jgi:hypothetical protein